METSGAGHATRGATEFFRIVQGIRREDRRIVFYAEHAGYYAYYEGLLDELGRRYRGRITYITSDPDDPILGTSRPEIVPVLLRRLFPFAMTLLDADVCVMTMTDLGHFGIRRSIRPVHYVYTFHSLISTHMGYLEGAFDAYDSILCTGPHHVAEIRAREQAAGLPPKTLVEAGYYRLERIYRAARVSGRHGIYGGRSDSTPVVLVAPSWGPGNILESPGEHLVAALIGAGYRVIVRPHPETVRRDPALIERLARRFADDPSFVLERSVATDDSLLRADVMISDVSGVALEYALGTERPVLFLDVPFRKVRNDRWRNLGIEPLELEIRNDLGMVIPPDVERIPGAVAALIRRRGEFRTSLARLRERVVPGFGRSSIIGAEHVLSMLDRHPAHESEQLPARARTD